MKKNITKILKIITIIITTLILGTINTNAVTTNTTTTSANQTSTTAIEKSLQEKGIDTSNLDMNKISDIYDEYSKQYSNDEMAKMIEENKAEIEKKTGLKEEAITAGANILKNTDSEQLKQILNNDIDLNKIQSQLEQGESLPTAINNNISTTDAAKIALKLLIANTIFMDTCKILFVLLSIGVILKWIIFNKAGAHGWASIIPIYRDIVYFKVCGISPLVILWWLLPVIGWIIIAIIIIVSRFKLAKGFGRGVGFGFGLWIFPTVFELILACSKKEYIGFEE